MSDTKPLPAQTLLALADDAVVGTCQKCRRRVKMSSVTHDGGHKTCAGPVKFGSAGKAYRAARAASPVTLEEALLREARQHLPGAIHTQDLRPCPECKTALRPSSKERCYKCFSVAIINARRLAGEGGGK